MQYAWNQCWTTNLPLALVFLEEVCKSLDDVRCRFSKILDATHLITMSSSSRSVLCLCRCKDEYPPDHGEFKSRPLLLFCPFLFFTFLPLVQALSSCSCSTFGYELQRSSLSLSLSLSRVLARGRFSLSLPHSPALSSLSLVKMKWRKCFGFRKNFKDSGAKRAHPTIRNAVSLFGHGLQSFFASGPQRSEVTVVENFFYKEIALAVGKMNYKVWCYFHTHAREHEQNGISFDSSISPGSLRTLKVGSLSRPRRHSLQSVSS